MLVLSRCQESTVHIGADITVTVLEIRKGRVKLGINAPDAVSVLRGELFPPASGNRSHVAAALSRITATRPR